MPTINGVRNEVAIPRRPTVAINGGKSDFINGNPPYGYNKWRMMWNGNCLAPPDPSCVLYLPGVPGFGTTIFDYSYSFSDSAIDTDEALDISETGVDCDADATTAIPIGSVIIIESEWMYVTATGTTLTVIRGYHGTTAATHATNQDIRVWIPNHGTISGATWVRLPNGLWTLSYDGANDTVTIADNPSLQITTAITVECWINSNWDGGGGANYVWFIDKTKYSMYQRITQKVLHFEVNIGGSGYDVSTGDMTAYFGTWFHAVGVYDGANVQLSINGVLVTPFAIAGTIADSTGINLLLGANVAQNRWYKGNLKLLRIYNRTMEIAEVASHYQQERWLFGV